MTSKTSKFEASAISEFLASRRSTRDFLPKPIPKKVLDQVLADAMTDKLLDHRAGTLPNILFDGMADMADTIVRLTLLDANP